MGRWGDVVIPRRQDEVIDLRDVEGLGDLLFVGASIVATTHNELAAPSRSKQAVINLGNFFLRLSFIYSSEELGSDRSDQC